MFSAHLNPGFLADTKRLGVLTYYASCSLFIDTEFNFHLKCAFSYISEKTYLPVIYEYDFSEKLSTGRVKNTLRDPISRDDNSDLFKS